MEHCKRSFLIDKDYLQGFIAVFRLGYLWPNIDDANTSTNDFFCVR